MTNDWSSDKPRLYEEIAFLPFSSQFKMFRRSVEDAILHSDYRASLEIPVLQTIPIFSLKRCVRVNFEETKPTLEYKSRVRIASSYDMA